MARPGADVNTVDHLLARRGKVACVELLHAWQVLALSSTNLVVPVRTKLASRTTRLMGWKVRHHHFLSSRSVSLRGPRYPRDTLLPSLYLQPNFARNGHCARQGDGAELSRWPWTAGPRAAEGAGARELRLKCAPGWVGRCMIAGRCVGVCMERHGQRMRSGCYLGLAARPFYTPACASEVRFAPPAPTQHTLGLQNTKIHMKRCGL